MLWEAMAGREAALGNDSHLGRVWPPLPPLLSCFASMLPRLQRAKASATAPAPLPEQPRSTAAFLPSFCSTAKATISKVSHASGKP